MKRLIAAVAAAALLASGQAGATIIDDWSSIKVPPAPTLAKNVKLDSKTTALLILDIVKQTCNQEHNPDCVASVPTVIDLAKRARAAGVKVIYSITATSTLKDILPGLEPHEGELSVQSAADKFFRTNLEDILKKDGIKTVILTGTRAQGAIMMTGIEAAYRNYQVVVPVDGQSSDVPYAKQYATWDLMNAPGAAGHVTETTADQISFTP